MLVLRLLVVLLSGFTLFSDEQERFICNTIQPGCSNVCFDIFAPVSVFHLWLFHFVLLCIPHVVFATYVAHKVLSRPDIEAFYCASGRGCSPFFLETSYSSTELYLHKAQLHNLPRFHCAYFLVVILRILLEGFFGAGQFIFFGLSIPKNFLCYEAPCTTGVECYISRPTEKTLMLNFMLGVSSLSILLSLVDLVSSIKALGTWKTKKAMLIEDMCKGEQTSTFTAAMAEDRDVLLTRRISPSESSNDAVNDRKASGGPVIKTGNPACDMKPENKDANATSRSSTPKSSPVPTHFVLHSQLRLCPGRESPLTGRGPNVGLCASVASAPQPDNSECQDKRAWV